MNHLYSDYYTESPSFTFVRGNVQITISFTHSSVKTTDFGRRYIEAYNLLKENLKNGNYGHDINLIDLVQAECMPMTAELAPRDTIAGLPLSGLCNAPCYDIKLVPSRSGDIELTGTENVTYGPTWYISPLSIEALSESCVDVPRVKASDVRLSAEDSTKNLDHKRGPTDGMRPQGVVRLNDGSKMYLKPCDYEKGFRREIEMLGKIRNAGFRDEVRTSRLTGIVVSGESDELVVGVLLDLIVPPKAGRHFMDKGILEMSEMFSKWERQVRTTVEQLHAKGIVWGDVNPCNVVIDEHLDAWVIDFGGSNNAEFVADDKAENVEGDWQGVGRLFGRYLTGPRGSEHSSDAYLRNIYGSAGQQ